MKFIELADYIGKKYGIDPKVIQKAFFSENNQFLEIMHMAQREMTEDEFEFFDRLFYSCLEMGSHPDEFLKENLSSFRKISQIHEKSFPPAPDKQKEN